MSAAEECFFLPSARSFKAELGDLSFYIHSWNISRQRIVAEQSSVNGENLVTNSSERFRRIYLEGIWVTDEDMSSLIHKLEEYIHNNTSFALTLQQLQFEDCRLIKYTAEEKSGESYINIKLDLISKAFTQEEEDNG